MRPIPKLADDNVVLGTMREAANDRYEEVVIGGLKTACLGRRQLAELMVEDCIAARAMPRAPKLVFASNGHAIAKAAIDSDFRHAFEQADIVHADGQPVVIASWFMGRRRIPGRSATTDFIYDVAAAARSHGLRVFLLGGSEDVNSRCAHVLRFLYPGLHIVGRHHGYFRRSEEVALCAEIARSGADILLVGLGVPLEYEFCVRNRARLAASWVLTCGGCYNFVTGDYKRAPRLMQKFCLEWLYRVIREPRRLFWRYVLTNPIALFMMATRSG